MAEYVALWGRDIETDSSPDPDSGSTGNGHHEPITEPIPVVEGEYAGYDEQDSGYVDDQSGYADDETAYVEAQPHYAEPGPEETVRAISYADPFIGRRPGSPGDSLTFKSSVTTPWFRTKRGLIVLIAVIVVVVVLALIPLLLRGPSDEPTNVTPSTGPTPTSVAPSLTSRPAPPPPPPPPPSPPPPPQDTPVYRPQYPSSGGSGSQAPKPEIGVTRTPISVAPKPVTPPTSAEVGKHGSTSRW